jgi:hypothetical protein
MDSLHHSGQWLWRLLTRLENRFVSRANEKFRSLLQRLFNLHGLNAVELESIFGSTAPAPERVNQERERSWTFKRAKSDFGIFSALENRH